MRYAILSKGDSKSNALKHKMMNYMQDFEMVEDVDNPEIVISVGETVHYFRPFINTVICCRDVHLSVYIRDI